MLRTATADVARIAPEAVEKEAATIPESDSTASRVGAVPSSSWYITGASPGSSPRTLLALSAIRDHVTPITKVKPAPMKQARWAISGVRAPKMRCMKSIATRSPTPSEISVAQFTGAPWEGSVSWPRSKGPMPSGTERPSSTATHTNRTSVATTVIAAWMTAV